MCDEDLLVSKPTEDSEDRFDAHMSINFDDIISITKNM